MSWLSSFFRRSVVQELLKLMLKGLVLILGNIGRDIWAIAKEEVAKVDPLDMTGSEKREMVLKAIRGRIDTSGIRSSLINWAVEGAVVVLNQAKQ